jgi:WD40-like Beta Propeller Repeat
MLDSVPRFVLFLLGAVLGLSALALPEQTRAGCSPNFHWTDFGPVWAPTGDRIAYQRIEMGCFGPRQTYVIDADGGPPARMPLGGERPSWSPDGRRLAFGPLLTIANADGSGHESLRHYPSWHPTWSPDGRLIAFGGGGGAGGPLDVYTIGSDGFGETNITNTPAVGQSNPTWCGPGDDRLVAHDTPSFLDGGLGRDKLTGGARWDFIDPGRGSDVVRAGRADDVVHARDGSVDRIACGGGRDAVAADPLDHVAADCEYVRRH